MINILIAHLLMFEITQFSLEITSINLNDWTHEKVHPIGKMWTWKVSVEQVARKVYIPGKKQ